VTCSSLVLHIFDYNYGIYIRLLELDGVHLQLVITSQGIIDNLVLVGYILPVITFTWEVSVQNNITGVITCSGRTAHVTWVQAWRFRRLRAREFRTEVYLLTGSELRVVRSEGGEEQPALEPVVEYTPIHSPRRGSAMVGFIFLSPLLLDRCHHLLWILDLLHQLLWCLEQFPRRNAVSCLRWTDVNIEDSPKSLYVDCSL